VEDRTIPKRYSLPFKEQAKKLFFIQIGPAEIHRRMKALPEGETLTKTTVERWCKNWKSDREVFMERAKAKTEQEALANIGEIVEENDELRKHLRKKILSGEAKPGSLEGCTYAVKALQDQKLKITGSERVFKQTREIMEKETIVQGTITDRIRRAREHTE